MQCTTRTVICVGTATDRHNGVARHLTSAGRFTLRSHVDDHESLNRPRRLRVLDASLERRGASIQASTKESIELNGAPKCVVQRNVASASRHPTYSVHAAVDQQTHDATRSASPVAHDVRRATIHLASVAQSNCCGGAACSGNQSSLIHSHHACTVISPTWGGRGATVNPQCAVCGDGPTW